MIGWELFLTTAVLFATISSNYGFSPVKTPCEMGVKLRDKWVFAERWTRNFVRIRHYAFIFFDKERGVKHRYTCTEKRGNIYLLVHQSPSADVKNVICMGFTYLGRSGQVEYAILRLNSNEKLELASPNLVPANASVSIDTTCDLLHNQRVRKVFAFVKRVGPGCKFPRDLRSVWQCTDMSALKVTINVTHVTYDLTNGQRISMKCHKRDASIFLVRIKNFRGSGSDAIMCLRMTKLKDDRDYKYKLLRLNSGTDFGGKLKRIASSKKAYIHQICDWIDSPARPEYLYT